MLSKRPSFQEKSQSLSFYMNAPVYKVWQVIWNYKLPVPRLRIRRSKYPESCKNSCAQSARAPRRTRVSDPPLPSKRRILLPKPIQGTKAHPRDAGTSPPRPGKQPPREDARLTCCKYIKVKAHESWGHMPTLGSATQVAPVRGCCIVSLWRPPSTSGDARMQSRRSLPGRYNFFFFIRSEI